jgi:hypothetical protein
MKRNFKNISAALVVMAFTAKAGAVPTDPGKEALAVKELRADSPVVQAKGQKVFVNLLNLEGESVTVKVVDSENRVLYLQRFEETQVVEKAFSFEQAYSGTYSVVVRNGEDLYSASVSVSR